VGAAAHARLDALKQGPREEEVSVAQIKADNAEADLNDALKNLANTLQDSYTKADDTLRTKIDRLFINPRSNNPQLVFSTGQSAYESQIVAERAQFEPLMASWHDAAASLTSGTISLDGLMTAEGNLQRLQALLDKCTLVVSALTTGQNLTQATIDSYRSDISAGRTVVAKALADLLASVAAERSVEAAGTLARSQLALVSAPTTPEGIREQEARAEQADAGIASLRAQMAKTTLRAPFAGIVTKQDTKLGEIIAANVPLISVISASALEIQANIPEADIALVKKNQPVRILIDAFVGEEFSGTVVAIDPAETLVEGAVAYQVTIVFAKPDERLKSGLTATLAIEVMKKPDVLVLPLSAITEMGHDAFVQRPARDQKGAPEKIPVILGVRGSDGLVEVVSGLSEGDTVLVNPLANP